MVKTRNKCALYHTHTHTHTHLPGRSAVLPSFHAEDWYNRRTHSRCVFRRGTAVDSTGQLRGASQAPGDMLSLSLSLSNACRCLHIGWRRRRRRENPGRCRLVSACILGRCIGRHIEDAINHWCARRRVRKKGRREKGGIFGSRGIQSKLHTVLYRETSRHVKQADSITVPYERMRVH